MNPNRVLSNIPRIGFFIIAIASALIIQYSLMKDHVIIGSFISRIPEIVIPLRPTMNIRIYDIAENTTSTIVVHGLMYKIGPTELSSGQYAVVMCHGPDVYSLALSLTAIIIYYTGCKIMNRMPIPHIRKCIALVIFTVLILLSQVNIYLYLQLSGMPRTIMLFDRGVLDLGKPFISVTIGPREYNAYIVPYDMGGDCILKLYWYKPFIVVLNTTNMSLNTVSESYIHALSLSESLKGTPIIILVSRDIASENMHLKIGYIRYYVVETGVSEGTLIILYLITPLIQLSVIIMVAAFYAYLRRIALKPQ